MRGERKAFDIIYLVASVAAVALSCGSSPGRVERHELESTLLPCEPACPSGHACYDGRCHATCELGCPVGTSCNADGLCVGDLADGPGDDFERNPCGGLYELPGLPGDVCGPCGTGRYVCETEDVVHCVDPVGMNVCGGCGELPGVPASPCGDGGRWACTPDGDLQCVDWLGMNPCLGTVPLDNPPGRPCGECGAGYWMCVGYNETMCVEQEPALGTCECDPISSPAISCGTEAGICGRGVRLCNGDGEYGSCVSAQLEQECSADLTCGQDGFCVHEQIGPEETPDDDCREVGDSECLRRVCRRLSGTRGCANNTDYAPSQGCADDFCRDLVVRPLNERCNGIDDNCDGRIDDDEDRLNICGSCPYNMMIVSNPDRFYGRERFCIAHYEASRFDATNDSTGSADWYVTSRPDVMPWHSVSADEAARACSGAAFNSEIPGGVAVMRLCVIDEWQLACNMAGERYPYGDDYVAGACNDASIGQSDPLATASSPECSYSEPGSNYPSYDMSGNVEEWIRGEEGALLAGGSFFDGEESVSCRSTRAPSGSDGDYDRGVGFRCCAAPIRLPQLEVER